MQGAFDSKLMLMPAAWHQGSYVKLEQGLLDLRAADRSLYWHVCERYLRSRSATITMIVERKTTRGVLKEPRRVVVDLWDPRVKPRKIREGISWLSERIPGELWLPADLLSVAAS